MMRLIPSEEYIIKTRKTADVIMKELHINTELRENLSLKRFPHNKSFIGTIGSISFRLIPGIQFGKSFRPIISGSISEHEGYRIITIKMQLIEAVLSFAIVWLSLCLVFFVMNVIFAENFSFSALMPLMLFIYGYGLMYFGFRYGVKKTKKKLAQMF